MSSGLRMRLAKIEAAQSPPTLWGDFVHENGRPTRHQLWSESIDLERWFATGELPKNVGVFVMVWTEGQMRQPDGWELFPELHPNTLKVLNKMITFSAVHGPPYFFDGHVFRGVGGVLTPSAQIRELMPHG